MNACRAGAVLGGPPVCPSPAIATDVAEALGLTAKWCPAHAEPLAKVAAELRTSRERMVKTKPERPKQSGDAIGRLPVAVRALSLARYVHAHSPRVSRADAAKAVGVSPSGGFHRLVTHAKEAGWVATISGPPGGIKPGETLPPHM